MAMISNCCHSTVPMDSDICSACYEHCESIDEDFICEDCGEVYSEENYNYDDEPRIDQYSERVVYGYTCPHCGHSGEY